MPSKRLSPGTRLPPGTTVGGSGYRTAVGEPEARIPVVLVHGTPYEMGWHLGRLTRDEIKQVIPKVMSRLKQTVGATDRQLREASGREPQHSTTTASRRSWPACPTGQECRSRSCKSAYAIPMLMPYSCSSVAAWGRATRTGASTRPAISIGSWPSGCTTSP